MVKCFFFFFCFLGVMLHTTKCHVMYIGVHYITKRKYYPHLSFNGTTTNTHKKMHAKKYTIFLKLN